MLADNWDLIMTMTNVSLYSDNDYDSIIEFFLTMKPSTCNSIIRTEKMWTDVIQRVGLCNLDVMVGEIWSVLKQNVVSVNVYVNVYWLTNLPYPDLSWVPFICTPGQLHQACCCWVPACTAIQFYCWFLKQCSDND